MNTLVFALTSLPTLGARGNLIGKLLEGDPVTWTIVGVVGAGFIAWKIFGSSSSSSEETASSDSSSSNESGSDE